MKPEWKDDLPNGAAVEMTPKGSMNVDTFKKWLEHFAKDKLPGNCLLIFDGAKCHIDISIVETAEKHNITLFCLPSNTTHELQPMDKAVFRSFEYHWDTEVLKYWSKTNNRAITKQRFGRLFSTVWDKALTPANIKSGFEATGIFPYDPDKIPEEAFAPSLPTHTDARQAETYSLQEEPNASQEEHQTSQAESQVSQEEPYTLQEEHTESQDEDSDKSISILIQNEINAQADSSRKTLNTTQVEGNFQAIDDDYTTDEDNVPLALLSSKEDKENQHENITFSQMMITPVKTSSNTVIRKKAVNSLALELKTSIFNTELQTRNKNKTNNEGTTKTNTKVVQKVTKPTQKKKAIQKRSCPAKESWYCFLCREDRVSDMRICNICTRYVHEECAGLTAGDKGIFVCPRCEED